MSKNIILTEIQINHISKRIAFQIYETFIDEKEIVIAGIKTNGLLFAEKIAKELQLISPLKISICEVYVNKTNPTDVVTTSLSVEQYTNKGIILIDDVLNTGSTLIYGVRHFLNVPLSKFKTAVLIDRNHKKYPVKADFKGISLSTSSKEHITVVFENNNTHAYLE
jgi:pyrimidine operon attenuation protein/uracil phosphoribosyltransferase